MPQTPEAQARVEIDRLLTTAGWHVCDVKEADNHSKLSVSRCKAGGKVDVGYYLGYRGKHKRKVRWEQLAEDLAYDPKQLDRDDHTAKCV